MTFHHAPDASEEASRAKRKAGSPPEGEDARQKRGGSAPPPDSAALELRRQELAEVYAAYDALYRAQLPENQTSDDGHVAVFPEASFLRLVKAGQGSDGCRRLAARLVPRFARRFPQHCAAATDILIGMSQLSMADPEQQATARADALAGLVDVAAAAMAAGAAGQQATIKLVDFCFKQLRRLAATTAATPVTHAAPTSNGELPNGCSSGATDRAVPAAGGKQGEQSLEAHLWPCLELCFTSHFRVVLAALLHALKNPGEPFYAVARQFITARLLSVPAASHSPAGGLASTAAGSNDEMEVDGGSFAAAPAATTTRQPAKQQRGEQQEVKPGTLAARVLGGLQPKEQGWVRAQVERWSKEVDASNSREAFTLLEQLLQHLPAAQVGVTPGWLAASVLPAAPARGVGGAEQQPAEQQQQQQQEQQTPSARGAAADAGRRQSPGSARQRQELQARSDRGRGREQLPSRSQSPESPSQQQQRSLRRVGSSRGFGGPPSAQARGRPRGSPSPAPNRRRSPSPWRTQQRQRSSSPWRTQQRQRSSSPWRRWSPGSDVDPQPGPDGTARRVSGGGGGSSPARRSRRSVDVAGADEGEQQAGSPGFIPRMPLGFPQPGVSPCLASACLYFAGLPRNLEERELRAECSKHSKVECAVRPPNVPGGAFVTFKSVRDASRCYEAMCDALPWRERGSPLRLSFVASQVYPPAAPQRIQQPPNHVWVAGVGSVADEAEVLRCCKEGAIPPPEHLLKVPARRPGLLLVFRDGAVAEAAVAAIRAGRPRILGPPGGPMPGGEPATAGPHLAAHRSGGFPRGPSGELREPPRDSQGGRGAERDRGDRGVLPANGREPRPGGELADLAGRTLWVGQIPPGIREEAVLELFRSHGELAGHKFLRHTGCMFVDFVMLAGAAEARQRLDGHRLAGGCLRVEFKNENQFRGGPGGGPGSRDGRQPLPSVGVGGREGVPLGVAAPRGGDGGRDRRLQHPPFRESIEPPAGLHRGRSGERELPGHSPYTVGVQQAQLDRGGGRSRSREGERAQHAPTLPRPRSSGGLDRPPQARASTPQRQQQQQHQQQGGGSRGGPTDGGGPSRQPPAAEAPPLAAATERRRQRRWEGVPALAAAAAEAPAQHAQPNSEQQQLSRLDSQMSSGAVPAASSLPPAAPPVPPVAARPPPPAAMLLPPGILGGGLPPPPTLPPPPARGMPPPRLVVPAVRPPTLAPPSLPFSPMAPGTQQPPPPSFPPPPTATAAAPPPLPRPQQGPPAWRGSLAKSRAPVCAAVCLDAGQGGAAGGWAAGEPQQWPQVLDVAHRADLQHVCYQMFPAVRPEERAVRRVGAADAAGRSALLDFSQYLRSKKRAGVVALPPLAPAGVQRAMYLVPPSEDVCRQLDVSWQSCTDCLLALVVPLTVQR